MTDMRSTAAPRWVTAVVWSLAVSLAVAGVVLAIASSSLLPLIAVAGLAVPMFPVATPGTSRTRGRQSHSARA